jgi:hypothetical protein
MFRDTSGYVVSGQVSGFSCQGSGVRGQSEGPLPPGV